MNNEDIHNVHQTLALLNNMIKSGEQHSEESLVMLYDAMRTMQDLNLNDTDNIIYMLTNHTGHVYVVEIITGLPGESNITVEFVTFSFPKALKWVNKYNDLVKAHKDRIVKWHFNGLSPYMGDVIVYDNPLAIYKEVKLK